MNTATAPLNAEEKQIVSLLKTNLNRRTVYGDCYYSRLYTTEDPELLRRLLFEIKEDMEQQPGATLKLIGEAAFEQLSEYN